MRYRETKRSWIMRQGMLPSQPLWEGIAVMDKAQSEKMKQYGAMLAIAIHLHERGLITDAEHHKLMAVSQKKYRPADSPAIRVSPTLNNNDTERVLRKEDLRGTRQ